MRIIDFHNHYYPPEYVDALKIASKSVVKVTYDDDGNPCVHYPGDYNILVPGHRDIDYRQRVLDEHGVDDAAPDLHDAGRPRRAARDFGRRGRAWSTTRSRAWSASARAASPRSRRCRSTIRPRRSPSSSAR